MRILFLGLELSGYFVACLEALSQRDDIELTVIRLRVNDEAPFKFSINPKIQIEIREEFNDKELLQFAISFDPELIYTAGWGDTGYKEVSAYFKKKGILVVMGMDNPWKGSLRQYLGCIAAPILVLNKFSHAWAAGPSQQKYARKLGFKDEHILKGVYSADVNKFLIPANKVVERSKVILYVGRFLDWKGVRELYCAFLSLAIEERRGWKLKMIGNGPLKTEFKNSGSIEILDFVQPTELVPIMQTAGAFCLPSWEEHWGVVVHEAAAAGCPILVSSGVESAKDFVQEGKNGYVFEAKSEKAIKAALVKMISRSEDKIKGMSANSVALAQKNTPEIWVDTFLSVLNKPSS